VDTATDRLRSNPPRDTTSIEAFQACVAALDAWPLTEPITGFDLCMIGPSRKDKT
jgi:hypothetical protein